MANELRGTNADDLINGTSGDDEIKTFDGDDIVIAGGGDDVVYTGLGEDRLEGGAGDDYLVSNEGDDILLGGSGSDRLFGCEDDDILDGGSGQDFINAGTGNDLLIFTAAENTGERAPDYYSGLEGVDTLRLQLTQAEFQAAQGDIQAFLSYIQQTTSANGESTGPFFRFQTLNLAVQGVENLEIIVADEIVFTTLPQAEDDDFDTNQGDVIDGTVRENDDVDPNSAFTIIENVSRGTLVLNADGSFTFDPNDEFDGLGDGDSATETFTYRVTHPDGTNVTATGTITIMGQNDAPIVTAITAEESEDAISFVIDLLEGASDVDTNDTLSVTNVMIDDGTTITPMPAPIPNTNEGTNIASANSVDGSKLSIDLSLYQYLAAGESLVLTVTYDVTDGITTTPNTAVLTIIGQNDAPVVSAITAQSSEDANNFIVNLLDGATDIDRSDTLSVSNVVIDDGSGAVTLNSGTTVGAEGTTNTASANTLTDALLSIDLSNYQSLGAGETLVITVTYDVSDGTTTTSNTASLTIVGENDGPTIAGGLSVTATESDSPIMINMLDGASDAEGDVLTATDFTVVSGDASGLMQRGSTLTLDPNAYSALFDGESEVIVVSYMISDGNGGAVMQTTTLTVNGEGSPQPSPTPNTAPVVAAPLVINVDETDGLTAIDLLAGASDADGDSLMVGTPVLISGDDVGAVSAAGSLSIDGSAYAQLLDAGDTETLVYEVVISDGNGGTVTQTVTINVIGANDPNIAPVVAAPITVDVDETDGLTVIDLLAGATDANGDTLVAGTPVLISGDASGAVTGAGTLSIDGTAYEQLLDAGDTETLIYEVEISDGNGGTVTQTVTINVIGADDPNTAPVVAAPIVIDLEETDGLTVIDLLAGASDADGDMLTAGTPTQLTGNPIGAVISAGSLAIDGTAYASFLNDGDTAILNFFVEISDGNGGTVTQFITVNVNGAGTTAPPPPTAPNNAPVIDTGLDISANEGDAAISVFLTDGISDADGDTLTVVNVTGLGTGLTYDAATFELTVDPNDPLFQTLAVGDTAEFTLTYDVIDGNGGSVSRTTLVEIEGVNNDPTTNDTLGRFFDETDSVTVVDLLAGADDVDDGTVLTVGSLTLVSGNDVGITFGTNTLIVDPSAYALLLDAGDTERVEYNYVISDGDGGTVTQRVTIFIEGSGVGSNAAPIINNSINFVAFEDDAATTIVLTDGVSDPEGQALSAINVTGITAGLTYDPATFEVTIDPSSAFFQSLAAGDEIVYMISYDVADTGGASVSRTTFINFIGENDDPVVAAPLTFNIQETDTLTFFDLLTGASDIDDGDVISAGDPTLVSGDDVGAITSLGTLGVDGTAYAAALNAGDTETLVYDYEISDGNGGSVTQTITINVIGAGTGGGPVVTINQPPVVISDIIETFDEGTGFFEVSALLFASDPDGDVLSVTNVSTLPSYMGFESGLNPRFIIATDSAALDSLAVGDSVTDTITFTINDGNGGTVDQTFVVTINGTNDDPLAGAPIDETFDESDVEQTVSLLTGASDIDDGDVLSVDNLTVISGDGSGLTLDGDNLIVSPSDYTALNAGETEVITFTYDIIDGNGGTVTNTGTITINGESAANQPPESNEEAQVFANEGSGERTVSALNNTNDPDGDTLTVVNLQALPDYLTFDVATQTFTLDSDHPDFDSMRDGQSFFERISYDVTDGNGGTTAHGLFVFVDGTNDDPVVAAPLTLTTQEDFTLDFLDLLTGASDVDDGDILSIRNVTGLNDGFIIDFAFGDLLIETGDNAFDFIRVGETFDFVINYEIHDLFGGMTTQTATITVEGSNDAPQTEGTLSGVVADGGTFGAVVFDLLQGASDPENTALSVTNFVFDPFAPTGFVFTFDAATGELTVNTDGFFVASAPEDFTFTYDVTDADGGTTTQSITITVVDSFTATNNTVPTASPIVLNFTEDTFPVFVDLLAGASDIDGDLLSVINIGALPEGFFFDAAANTINASSFFLQSLNATETITFSVNYTIIDGVDSFGTFVPNGGSIDNSISITIQGVNDDPTNFAPLTATLGEDDALVRIDLLQNSNDVDNGDVLTVDGFPSTGGLEQTRFDGDRYLAIDLDAFAYQRLSAGESEDYNISYTVSDGNGGSVVQTGVVTIIGVNDVATRNTIIGFNFDDGDGAFSSDLSGLINETDTNDVYTLDSVTLDSFNLSNLGTPVFSFTGGVFSFDPSQFGALDEDFPNSVTFEFTFTSGPDTITSTFDVFIEGSENRTQQPLDEKDKIDIYEPGPDVPIVFDGPDGVYAPGLDDDFDIAFDSGTGDSFDFDDKAVDETPIMPTLDDTVFTDDVFSDAVMTKDMAFDSNYDGDPPLKATVFDGLQSYEIDVDLGAI